MIKSYIITLILLSCLMTAGAHVKLPVIFQDHMVLQRDKPCRVWGWADAGEKICVSVNGHSRQTVAGPEKSWLVTLPAQKAGGPYDIVISGKNRIILKDILLGDVWICGGQSNMQFKVQEIGGQTDTLKGNDRIRIFTATIGSDYVAQNDLKGGVWNTATAEAIKSFSAVGYFFGEHLEQQLKVPIGLISSNLGATSIETWMSPEAIRPFPQFTSYYSRYLAPQKSFREISEVFAEIKSDWEQQYYMKDDPGLLEKWFLPVTGFSDWKEMELPGNWEQKGLVDYDGSVWFQRSFDLPGEGADTAFMINLGKADDYSITWVNGHQVGETYGNQNAAVFRLPHSILKKKDNCLVVRVFDAGGAGGLYNMFWDMRLAGKWRYKTGRRIDARSFIKPFVINADVFTAPSNLYNANIAPLKTLAVKGFIWYQGEANTARAAEYKSLLPAFIKDWRKQFGQGDLPFLMVQLANYGAASPTPAESEWAELREAQASALTLPATGIAAAIDIGEANNIHPHNKQDVGKRLALAALKKAYGINSIHLSPAYHHHAIDSGRVVIHFGSGAEVQTRDPHGYVKGFSIAGPDRKFYWAQAYVRRNTIVVYHPGIKTPVAVRYAWANNPGTLDLYNPQGLPVLPFRTDNWEGVTGGTVFELAD